MSGAGTAWPRRVVVLLWAGATLLGLSAPAWSQGEAVDAATHLRRLDEAISVAEEGVETPTREGLATIRRLAGAPTTIEVAGSRLELPGDPVLSRLTAPSPETFQVALNRLQSLRDAFDAAVQVDAVDRDELEARVAAAYRQLESSPTVQERLWRFAEDLLIRIAELLTSANSGVGLAAAVVLGLLGVVGLWALGRRLMVVVDEHAPPERPSTRRPEDWRALADAALERGDLEAAVRAEYQLLLLQLTRRGAIRDQPSLTPAEARRAVAGDRVLVDPVAMATGVFERMAYAARPPDRGEVDRIRNAVEEVAP